MWRDCRADSIVDRFTGYGGRFAILTVPVFLWPLIYANCRISA